MPATLKSYDTLWVEFGSFRFPSGGNRFRDALHGVSEPITVEARVFHTDTIYQVLQRFDRG